METDEELLGASALNIEVADRVLIRDLSFSLRRGEFVAILGRNGCGKSLALHALAGLRAPSSGAVRLLGEPMGQLTRAQIARSLGLLPQDREEALSQTALESTLIGRHPQLRFWQREGAQDVAMAQAALERLGIAHCAERLLSSLSGGEQRRAAMAALLTQQPQVYLLDEPTNHLDPHHQIEILALFRELCARGAAVMASLHDPTLAERFAERALLLHGDGRWRLGAVAQVLDAPQLSELYLTPFSELRSHERRVFIVS